jgi:lipopolysaccharide export system permease protein
MSIYSRYILRSLATSMFFVTVTVSCAVWLTQSIHFLQLAVNGSAPLGTFIMLVMLSLPNFIIIVLPLALLAIILFVYNRLIMESELVVLRAAGLHPWALARPGLWLSLGMAVLVFTMNAYIGPLSNRTMKSLRQEAQNEYTGILIRDGVFNTIGQMTIYVRERSTLGDLLGIMIEDDKDPQHPKTIFAKRGQLVDTENGPRLLVYDGERQEIDHATGHVSRLNFDDYSLDLKFLDEETNEHWLEPSERTLTQLLTPSIDPRDAGYEKYFFAEANSRIASPIFALDFAFVGLACLLVGEFDRRGQTKRIIRAILFALLIEMTAIGLSNLSRKYAGAIPFLYVAGVLPLLMSYLIIKRRSETLRPVTLLGLFKR